MKKLFNIVLISILIGLSTQEKTCLDYDNYDVECFKPDLMKHLCNGNYTNVLNCSNVTTVFEEDDSNTSEVIGVRINFGESVPDLVALGVLNLGVEIFKKTTSQSKDKIQVISPLSIAGATSLIQLGAKGQTLIELRKINGQIKSDDDDNLSSKEYHENFRILLEEITSKESNSENHTISVANAIFVKSILKLIPEYKNAAIQVYKSHIENLDFQNESKLSTKVINNWVNTTTNGKINKIVNAVEPDTQVVIVSTLYFKALWDPDIGVQAVVSDLFYPNGETGRSIEVDMLLIDGGKYLFHKSKEFDCRMIGLDYDNGISSMFIILPNHSSKQKLLDLQSKLTADNIEEMISKTKNKSATIVLPKFHVEQSSDIQTALKDLGLKSLFNSESDLSLMASSKERNKETDQSTQLNSKDALDALENITSLQNPNIYVDKIIHKVVLSVDEFGTEGGAATGGFVNKQGVSVLFVANSPFLFLIRHNPTKLPIFYGAVFEPSFNK